MARVNRQLRMKQWPRLNQWAQRTVAIKARTARQLGHLDALESEAIHIMREVAAECANPALLFSGGKIPSFCCDWRKKLFARGIFRFP